MRIVQAIQVGQQSRQAWIRSLSSSAQLCRHQSNETIQQPASFPPEVDFASLGRVYKKWETEGQFKAGRNASAKKVYNMLLPPPNVTGKLHIGHAFTVAQEDALCRWRRLCGDDVRYIPGTDHAGIATQSRVERLLKDQGSDVASMSRAERLEHIHRWKEEHGNHIGDQLRKLGISCDWSQEFFTLDDQRAASVSEAFMQFFKRGLIYRRVRFANWCCHLQTVISDIEVDEEKYDRPTEIQVVGYDGLLKVGLMHHIAYPLESGGEVVVATTRPETIPADAALAVHPDDVRYSHLHGMSAINPVTHKPIPIICDAELVDMDKGTGIVKVTPCHDPRDYECGLRFDLPQEVVFSEDGYMSLSDGDRVHRFAGRQLILSKLQHEGLYRGTVKHPMVVQRCSRSGDIIEPILYPQWFLKMGEFCRHAMRAVETGDLKISPSQYTDVWNSWLSKEQDWCISRQLYWGHRIPAWKVVAGLPNQEQVDAGSVDNQVWVVGTSEEEAKQMAVSSHNCDSDKVAVSQEDDVLDTWFSSALLPLSTAGWPTLPEVSDFYPLSVMETGSDILFFWVARMYMLCTALHPDKQAPFSTVLLHSLIKDASGAKMSKSKGNVVDPLDIINGVSYDKVLGKRAGTTMFADKLKAVSPDAFPACGADSLRYCLNKSTKGADDRARDIDFDVYEVVLAKAFGVKVWNGVRFASMTWPVGFQPSPVVVFDATRYSTLDRWIMNRAACLLAEYETLMSTHQLGNAALLVQDYFRDQLCTQYFQFVRVQGEIAESLDILYHSIAIGLQVIHPFMPFLTEALWQRLPHPKGTPPNILDSRLPTAEELSPWRSQELDTQKEMLQKIANAGNSVLQEFKPSALTFCTTSADQLSLIEENQAMLARYYNIDSFTVKGEMPSDTSKMLVSSVDNHSTFFIYGKDIEADAIVKACRNKLRACQTQLEKMLAAQARPGYADKVPQAVKDKDNLRIAGLRKSIASLEHNMSLLPQPE